MRRVIALLALAASVAACGGDRSTPSAARGAAADGLRGSVALAPGSRLLLNAQQPLSWAYATGGSLYYAYSSPVGEHTGESYKLTRVDDAGRVAATRLFTSPLDDMVVARKSLWLTTTAGGTQTSLWRLDPDSLRVRSEQNLPASPYAQGIAGSLAVAAGQLWVGTGVLDRVSLASGRVDRVVDPAHRGPIQLVADSTGRVLLASLGYQHPTYVARLNPETGALVSELKVPESDSQPRLGGIVDGGAWIENTLGSNSSAWRISLAPLKAATATDRMTRAGRVSVQAIDGSLWVTEPVGQVNLNYCADPVSGRPLVRLPPLPGNSVFLTADGTDFFYTDVPLNAHVVKLEAAPISRRCDS